MSDAASSRRSYHSPRREAQAQATRDAILEAARRLFAERGVAATTLAAIAEAATVSRPTVVAAFGTKRAILEALIARLARGGDAEVPVSKQDESRAMLAADDAADVLRRLARIVRSMHERTAELIDIVTREARADTELEDVRRTGAERRLRDLRRVVDVLAEHSWLRPGLARAEAAETLWALTHPTLYRTLTTERGWSPARWERWLSDVSYRALVSGA